MPQVFKVIGMHSLYQCALLTPLAKRLSIHFLIITPSVMFRTNYARLSVTVCECKLWKMPEGKKTKEQQKYMERKQLSTLHFAVVHDFINKLLWNRCFVHQSVTVWWFPAGLRIKCSSERYNNSQPHYLGWGFFFLKQKISKVLTEKCKVSSGIRKIKP